MTTKSTRARSARKRRSSSEAGDDVAPKTDRPAPPQRLQPLTAEQRDAAIALLQSWIDADEDETQDQRETFDALRKGLNRERARLGMRLIFPE